MGESIIQIQHLFKTFGSGDSAVHALDDINLDIQQGEIFGIIGLSGAGKSTLVRCMNLLECPTSGTVIVDGQKFVWMEPDGAEGKLRCISERELRLARRKITMIFQSFNLLMQRTCLKNICFPWRLAAFLLRKPGSGPWSYWSWWDCWKRQTPIQPSSPAGKNSVSPLPVRWPQIPRCCCATRRLPP